MGKADISQLVSFTCMLVIPSWLNSYTNKITHHVFLEVTHHNVKLIFGECSTSSYVGLHYGSSWHSLFEGIFVLTSLQPICKLVGPFWEVLVLSI